MEGEIIVAERQSQMILWSFDKIFIILRTVLRGIFVIDKKGDDVGSHEFKHAQTDRRWIYMTSFLRQSRPHAPARRRLNFDIQLPHRTRARTLIDSPFQTMDSIVLSIVPRRRSRMAQIVSPCRFRYHHNQHLSNPPSVLLS